MPSPYLAEEVASALSESARRAGMRLERLEVVADEAARVWIILATPPHGDVQRMTFPFASARGIYTPAEIANHLVHDTWPFT
jgi:hypothetical protein